MERCGLERSDLTVVALGHLFWQGPSPTMPCANMPCESSARPEHSSGSRDHPYRCPVPPSGPSHRPASLVISSILPPFLCAGAAHLLLSSFGERFVGLGLASPPTPVLSSHAAVKIIGWDLEGHRCEGSRRFCEDLLGSRALSVLATLCVLA